MPNGPSLAAKLSRSDDDIAVLTDDGNAVTVVHHFGPADRRLFGALHVPADEPVGAVLVCSPIWAEMARNYRREVLLGRALAREGFAALRFHYWATGNSGGDSTELGFDGMCADARMAVQHLQDQVGDVALCAVGTRLGAVVAATVAEERGAAALAVWDPVLDPKRYFREVFRARMMTELKRGESRATPSQAFVEQLERDGVVEVAGYPVTAAVYREALVRPLVTVVGSGRVPLLLLEMNRQLRLSKPAGGLLATRAAHGVPTETDLVDHTEAWWFGAADRDGAADARVAGQSVVPRTVEFLRRRVGDEAVVA